jgi:hypothetical protein
MRSSICPGIIILLAILTAGCLQLPGMHSIKNSPDPVIGQWVGGELPASDLHLIFFENHSYSSYSFYLNQGEKNEWGNWTRNESDLVIIRSGSGNISTWVYDPSDDSVYLLGLPQRKYYRYKG